MLSRRQLPQYSCLPQTLLLRIFRGSQASSRCDRFLPHQFANRGDKLVFSNGILILGVLASILIVIFAGDTSRLIPLYAVGVFLSRFRRQAWSAIGSRYGETRS